MTANVEPIRKRHVAAPSADGPDRCHQCIQLWPCDTAAVLAELDALRSHTLNSNPALRALHEQAVAHMSAVEAYTEQYGPLSTTLAWAIRYGSLAPKETGP